MKNLTINYQKNYGETGTVYTQTIKISETIAERFNQFISKTKAETQKEIDKKHFASYEELKMLDFLQPLSFTINYINLTTLEYFKKFYLKNIYKAPKKDRDFERILNRNTIFEII